MHSGCETGKACVDEGSGTEGAGAGAGGERGANHKRDGSAARALAS